jgi:hypothetical protein
MKIQKCTLNHKGQALITLLFFIVIAVTITSAAIILILVGSVSATKLQEGTKSYYIAESGIENALMRLIRNPSYTGETLPVGDGSVEISVTGASPYTITAIGGVGEYRRTIRATAQYVTGYLSVTSWEEI